MTTPAWKRTEQAAKRRYDAEVSERAFTDQVVALARLRCWRIAHFRPAMDSHGRWKTAMIGDPGFPDLVLARSDRVVFAELKAETGRVAPAQQEWLDVLAELDTPAVEVHVWKPSDWSEIEEVLK